MCSANLGAPFHEVYKEALRTREPLPAPESDDGLVGRAIVGGLAGAVVGGPVGLVVGAVTGVAARNRPKR